MAVKHGIYDYPDPSGATKAVRKTKLSEDHAGQKLCVSSQVSKQYLIFSARNDIELAYSRKEGNVFFLQESIGLCVCYH